MSSNAQILTFDDWVQGMFSDAEVIGWDRELAPIIALEYATALFVRSGSILRQFSDSNVDMGLNRIIREGDNQLDALFDSNTSDAVRIQFIESIEQVYAEVFAIRCEPVLCQLGEDGRTPLNSVCYMWWDIFPTWGKPMKPQFRNLDAAVLDLLGRLLSIRHDACLESALHGLGHWHLHYAREVEAIIDGFLSCSAHLRPELREYALHARSGMVL